MIDSKEIYDNLVTLGEAWSDAHAASELLDETKRVILANLMNDCTEKSSAAKETFALSHPDYKEHIEKMVRAKRAANRARVKYDAAKVWCDLKRTEAATERAASRYAV